MPEHVHKWRIFGGGDEGFFLDCECGASLDYEEAERRLNATEKLSGQDAEFLAGFTNWYAVDHPDGTGTWSQEDISKLGQKGIAYASALEGE